MWSLWKDWLIDWLIFFTFLLNCLVSWWPRLVSCSRRKQIMTFLLHVFRDDSIERPRLTWESVIIICPDAWDCGSCVIGKAGGQITVMFVIKLFKEENFFPGVVFKMTTHFLLFPVMLKTWPTARKVSKLKKKEEEWKEKEIDKSWKHVLLIGKFCMVNDTLH